MPDTTDWKWWNWLLAVIAVIILGPIVLAIGVSSLSLYTIFFTGTSPSKSSSYIATRNTGKWVVIAIEYPTGTHGLTYAQPKVYYYY